MIGTRGFERFPFLLVLAVFSFLTPIPVRTSGNDNPVTFAVEWNGDQMEISRIASEDITVDYEEEMKDICRVVLERADQHFDRQSKKKEKTSFVRNGLTVNVVFAGTKTDANAADANESNPET